MLSLKLKNSLNINIIIVLISFILLNSIFIFKIIKNEYNKKDIIRLHVVANSNSISDKIVKLKVENSIKDYLNELELPSDIKHDEYLDILKSKNSEILDISNTVLKNNNFNYDSSLKIGKIYYDKKQSVLLDMDSGTYDSMQLILGKGEGENIWSIIFPNEENISCIKELDTILPGIKDLYESNEDTKKDDKNISSIFEELFLKFKDKQY